jgi:hypothetical protein
MIRVLPTSKIGAIAVLALRVGVCLAAAGPATPASLALDIGRMDDVREIKNLQRVYAQLAQYSLWHDMAALFMDTGTLDWGTTSSEDGRSATGIREIEHWFETDAGKFGARHVLVNDMPVVSLSEDGRTAKGSWAVMRISGTSGAAMSEGGVFENEYVQSDARWKISSLRYYPLHASNHTEGWRTLEEHSSASPYHFTPDQAGLPILLGREHSSPNLNDSLTVEELAYRVSQLNEEDAVRNLVHAMGYYIDQRMWADVVSLFTTNGTATLNGVSSSPGPAGIRSWLEVTMGPEGLTRGVLNDRPIFDTVIQLSPDILTATVHGLEIALTINTTNPTQQRHFLTFHHTLKRDTSTGTWKLHHLNYTHLNLAPQPTNTTSRQNQPIQPPSLPVAVPTPHLHPPKDWRPLHRTTTRDPTNDGYNLETLHRLLSRSAAYDETENVSGAYGLYLMGMGNRTDIGATAGAEMPDDGARSGCKHVAGLFAREGIAQVRGVGWVRGLERVEEGCEFVRRGPGVESGLQWRVQPVILVSLDGRAATVRVRMLDWGGLGGGVYHDQVVLEDGQDNLDGEDGMARRKLWCVSLDEYSRGGGNESSGERHVTAGFVPDVSLRDPLLGEREVGFVGGPGAPVVWPTIQRMWWEYRNPVTGAVPDSYWAPGCVPCRGARPDWSLADNEYQEPVTGPTRMRAAINGSTVLVNVGGGPEEFAWGVVELHHVSGRSTQMLATAILDGDGNAELEVPSTTVTVSGSDSLVVYYLGNDRLEPGRTTVEVSGLV